MVSPPAVLAVPAPLRLTLTYDQGRRWRGTRNWPLSQACAFTSPTRMSPGSAAPTRTPTAWCASTWPLGADLSAFSQAELDAIAARLNSLPRNTLGFATPDEVFAALVDKAANAVTARNAATGACAIGTWIQTSCYDWNV